MKIQLMAIKPNMVVMLDVSTIHIPRHTSIALGEDHHSPESAELCNVLSYVFWHKYGWVIACNQDAKLSVADSHPELANLIGICVSHGIFYLKLDADALEIEGLPIFDWEDKTKLWF